MISFQIEQHKQGKIIAQYLKGNIYLSDEAIHILFSKNRGKLLIQLKQIFLMVLQSLLIDILIWNAFSVAKGFRF